MDPIQININVSLDLTDRAVSLVQDLLGRVKEPAPQHKPEPRKPETKPEPRKPETKEDPQPAAPQQRAEEAPVSAPEAPAPAPVEEDLPISDEELRQVVFAARKAKPGNPQEIKNVIFPEFGIKTSMECPMERRAELVARLNKLIA